MKGSTIESIGPLGRCWRGAVRETRSGLQVTWHDGSQCAGPKQQCCHAVVVGQPQRVALFDDCSGRRVKQVDTVTSFYTAGEAEAKAAYEDAVKRVRAGGA